MKKNETILELLHEISKEKQIKVEDVVSALKEGITKTLLRSQHITDLEEDVEHNIVVDINLNSGDIQIFRLMKVVEKVENPDLEISIHAIKANNPYLVVGDIYKLDIKGDKLSRLAILQAIQIIKQQWREAEKKSIYDEFIEFKDQIMSGLVENIKANGAWIAVNRAYAFLPKQNQIAGEIYNTTPPYNKLNFYVEDVLKQQNNKQILVSRTHPRFLYRLLEMEIPEIQKGIVEIKAVQRIPGLRAKVAVYSHDDNIDAVGACIGAKGARIQTISQELNGEKIDVINWDADLHQFILNAIAPAKVISLQLTKMDQKKNEAKIIVLDEQQSLVIGKNGSTAKLVSWLTNCRIDVIAWKDALAAGMEIEWNGNLTEQDAVILRERILQSNRRKNG